jgi:hypothetical protein
LATTNDSFITIRPAQWDSLAAEAFQNFQDQVVAHIRECFPKEFSILGDSHTRLLVNMGAEASLFYEVKGKQDICSFIDLMMIFGPDFDIDPYLPWANAILVDTGLPGSEKMPRLLDRARLELKRLGTTGAMYSNAE